MTLKRPMYWFSNIQKRVDRGPKNSTEVLQGILQNSKSPLGNAFQTWKMYQIWEKVVGENIAKVSRPKNYYKGTLFIAVKNSVWLQELSYMSTPIKDKVNEAAGWDWIQKVIFTLESSDDSTAAKNVRD